MKQNSIYLILVIGVLKIASAQTFVGDKFDINGIPLNGYHDEMIYSPENKLEKVRVSDSYELGYYYDRQGTKIEGYVKFDNGNIYYKKYMGNQPAFIRPFESIGFVIALDSFFVIDNYYFKNVLKTKPTFVQYITEFEDLVFVKHHRFISSLGQAYAALPTTIQTFLVKGKNDSIWENFREGIEFKERALKYFGNDPYLNKQISAGKYTSKDMLSIIKYVEYKIKHEKSESIYLNKYWDQISDSTKAEYVAEITEKKDSIFTFEYFKGQSKLYKVHYSSFYPHVKNGDFIAYYPNGALRKSITYEKGMASETKVFSESEKLKTHYEYQYDEDKKLKEIKYLTVNYNLTNSSRPDEQIELTREGEYSRRYLKNKMISSFQLMGSDTIFQIVNMDYDFKIKTLQKKFSAFMSSKRFNEALSENAQGHILISVTIDKKGISREAEILTKIHPEIDSLVEVFVQNKLNSEAIYPHKFKPYIKGGEKQFCEVIIPIEFSIKRLYGEKFQFNYMPQPAMHTPAIPPIRPPKF